MRLPLLLSVPHGGLEVPPEVSGICLLTVEDIIADGDDGARDVYALESEVAGFVAADVARAIVDLNRAPDDRGRDGVVKTHTCWDVPIYAEPLSEELAERLLADYYCPYHNKLTELASAVVLGLDCHTMAAIGPPVGPDPGAARPAVCLSNADGTCPDAWMHSLAACLERSLGFSVSINNPFKGGYTIRRHASEIPWMQVELSRAPFMSWEEKRERILAALGEWCIQEGFSA
jgi:N-formylglutamate deformylase